MPLTVIMASAVLTMVLLLGAGCDGGRAARVGAVSLSALARAVGHQDGAGGAGALLG